MLLYAVKEGRSREEGRESVCDCIVCRYDVSGYINILQIPKVHVYVHVHVHAIYN